MIDKMRVEFDLPKQQALAKDIQRQIAGQAYFLVNPGSVKPFQVVWPAIGNVASTTSSARPTPHQWRRLKLA